MGPVLAAPSESCVGVAHRAEPGAWAVPSRPSAVQGSRAYTGGKASGAWPWAGGALRSGRGGWTRCLDRGRACVDPSRRPPGPQEVVLCGRAFQKMLPAATGGPGPWAHSWWGRGADPHVPLALVLESPPRRPLTPALRTTATSPHGFLVCCHPHGSASSLHVCCQRGPVYWVKLVQGTTANANKPQFLTLSSVSLIDSGTSCRDGGPPS